MVEGLQDFRTKVGEKFLHERDQFVIPATWLPFDNDGSGNPSPSRYPPLLDSRVRRNDMTRVVRNYKLLALCRDPFDKLRSGSEGHGYRHHRQTK